LIERLEMTHGTRPKRLAARLERTARMASLVDLAADGG
jgi:hypothetical protein